MGWILQEAQLQQQEKQLRRIIMNKVILGTLVFAAGVVSEKKFDIYKKAEKYGKTLYEKIQDLYKDCCEKVKEGVEEVKEEVEDAVEEAKSKTKD